MLVDLANQTVKDGHRVSVCVTRSQLTLARELDPRIELLVLHRRARFSPIALGRLAAYVRRNAVDVVHVHMRSNLLFIVQLRIARLVRTPIVFHDHYGTIETDSSIPRWFPVARRYITFYVGVYDRLEQWARRAGVPAARAITIPNALDLSRLAVGRPSTIRDDLSIDAAISIALVIATLRRDKAIEVLLEAVAHSRHRSRLKVLVAGSDGEPAYASRCRARCVELGLDDTVVFLGGRTDVPDLLRSVDLGLLSSHTESGPLVLVEYLAASLPFASTLVGDIGRRLASMKLPGFVHPGDTIALAEEMDKILDLSPAERQARGRQGYEHLVEHWDLRSLMPRWYNVYRAAIAETP
jgi:glycosyltransferase involved in cell wall biosynthesis